MASIFFLFRILLLRVIIIERILHCWAFIGGRGRGRRGKFKGEGCRGAPFDQTTTIPLRALERDYIRFYPPGLDGPIVLSFLHTWYLLAARPNTWLWSLTTMLIQRLCHGGLYLDSHFPSITDKYPYPAIDIYVCAPLPKMTSTQDRPRRSKLGSSTARKTRKVLLSKILSTVSQVGSYRWVYMCVCVCDWDAF